MPPAALPSHPLESAALSLAVLEERYLAPHERLKEDVQRRVASALAQIEPPGELDRWATAFMAAQLAGFIPGGRVNANAGLSPSPMLVNCFVQPCQTASGGLDEGLALALGTLGLGGGVGYDFSVVAPAGPDGAGGPVAAIARFNAACAAIDASQCRRCAQMALLRCDHPDIMPFIHAKRRGGLSNFNLSVAVTDDFMREALCRGGRREVWLAMLQSALDHGEPGVLFIDTINRDNNLAAIERIAATNPCGEQPLPDYGACVLGSLNLTRFVRAPFSAQARFDWRAFGGVVGVAVRMLDNTLEVTGWPLPAHQREAHAKRRVGLGVTGLADALIMLGLRYGSVGACAFAARLASRLRNRAYLASVKLAVARGAFPLFSAEDYLARGRFASRLPTSLREAIRRHGIRNSHLLSIAPAGSISIAFADNVANGIEPVLAWRHTRRMRMKDARVESFLAENFAWRRYREAGADASHLPAWFVTADGLPLQAHGRMLAAMAPFIDAGISKTVNLPEDTRLDDLERLMIQAWRDGVKGLTCFPWHTARGVVSALEAGSQAGSASGMI